MADPRVAGTLIAAADAVLVPRSVGGWAMAEEGNAGWTVVSATRSDICYRGVSGRVCA